MALHTKRHPISPTSTRFTATLDRRVLQFVRKREVLRKGERILVAVSGGPDSTALLLILARLSSVLEIQLTVAHFDHKLRGQDEAAADLDFVRSLPSGLNAPFAHGSGDVGSRARDNHESLEDAARRLRYSFLAEQAALAAASCVLTGHTMDDQAETVLLHLIRGAGLDGLAGMRPRSPWPFGPGPELARPLLCLTREETVRYCAESGIQPRQDPTNLLPIATRNRVRSQVIPLLGEINPRITQALVRLAASAAEDIDYLSELTYDVFAEHARVKPGSVLLVRSLLNSFPRALTARLVARAVAHISGTPAGLEGDHIEAVLDLASSPPGTLSLPGGVTVSSDSHSVLFHRGRPPRAEPVPATTLHIPGGTRIPGGLIRARIEDPPHNPHSHDPLHAYLDAARTGLDLTVRSRRPGDRLRPLGLGGEKKLQDILVDAKVPARDRDGVPLVCGAVGIIWVAGHCIDQRYALGPDSRQALHLSLRSSPPAPNR